MSDVVLATGVHRGGYPTRSLAIWRLSLLSTPLNAAGLDAKQRCEDARVSMGEGFLMISVVISSVNNTNWPCYNIHQQGPLST